MSRVGTRKARRVKTNTWPSADKCRRLLSSRSPVHPVVCPISSPEETEKQVHVAGVKKFGKCCDLRRELQLFLSLFAESLLFYRFWWDIKVVWAEKSPNLNRTDVWGYSQ